MGDEIIAALISTSITSVITIIGLIVTYKMNKRNYKEELKNNKTTLNIEKLQSIILDVSNLLNNPNNISPEKYQLLVSNILSYGSLDAIKILTYLQSSLYNNQNVKLENNEKNNNQTILTITAYCLLITQIKYDLTGEILPPLAYAKIKLTDFKHLENEFYIKNNEIISELHLNENFKTF